MYSKVKVRETRWVKLKKVGRALIGFFDDGTREVLLSRDMYFDPRMFRKANEKDFLGKTREKVNWIREEIISESCYQLREGW